MEQLAEKKKLPGKPMTWQRQLKRLAVLLAAAYVLLFLLAALGAERLLFCPRASSYKDSPAILKISTADGQTLSAKYFTNPEAKFSILYSHGNGEDMGDMNYVYQMICGDGFNVLAYDYRGYGTSSRVLPTEEGSYRDIDAAYDYLTKTLKVSPNRIILLGRSIGGGPSVDLALRRPVAGLIMESAFTSAFRIPLRLRLLPWDKFDNLSKITQVRCPILIIHGRSDMIIPCWHGRKLFEAAPEPKQCLWVDSAGHNDLSETAGPSYDQALKDFERLLEHKPFAPNP